MSGLASSQKGKVRMEVVMCDDADPELIKEQFGDDRHGLLVRNGDGEIVDKISGHNFGKDEILAAIAKLND